MTSKLTLHKVLFYGHVFKAVPIGQFQRLRRNCSTETEFLSKSIELRDRFLARGYSLPLLETAFVRALRENRNTLLNRTKTLEKSAQCTSPMFITTYSRQFYKIMKLVQKYLPVLNGDDKLWKVMENGCRVVTRRTRTLGNILSPSDVCEKVNSPRTWLNIVGTYRCGATRCVTCYHMEKSSEFVSNSTTTIYHNKCYINCNTTYVVYLLACKKCNIQYVGSTSRNLKCRVREHIHSIESRSNSTTVSRHFLECNDCDINNLKIQGIEKI
ncbi:hypothetical protein XELAEV_18036989mg [Xenopus laevis]|uniref:GIY-YIG domain-containing protein n=1 Tax=Xenopus laevis TaxID=8355 RepID=A0A974H9S3_XENLA|nr:hypothetical protein XELAEV_18036989mg [Xenopus laevis]